MEQAAWLASKSREMNDRRDNAAKMTDDKGSNDENDNNDEERIVEWESEEGADGGDGDIVHIPNQAPIMTKGHFHPDQNKNQMFAVSNSLYNIPWRYIHRLGFINICLQITLIKNTKDLAQD